jgi:hypothetical protein
VPADDFRSAAVLDTKFGPWKVYLVTGVPLPTSALS